MSTCSRCKGTRIVVKPRWQEACPSCSPPKTFDAESLQGLAASHRAEMAGHYYRHYKGGLYYVIDVLVDEATGDLRVDYRSMDKKTASGQWYKWSRLLSVFNEKGRFVQIDGDGNVHGD